MRVRIAPRETMDHALSRRHLIAGLALAALACPAQAASDLEEIERQHGMRIGAVMRGSDGRIHFAHRADERFRLCSTFKIFLAAEVYRQAAKDPHLLQRPVTIRDTDRLGNSPVTARQQDGGTLSAEMLCKAAVQYSDNSAANYLLDLVGGPPAVTRLFRTLGDNISRLDRMEPALNLGAPEDLRDTTTPAAIARSLGTLLLTSTVLGDHQRATLLGWMRNEQNGTRRIRAGVPRSWTVANKPGTNDAGAVNDIAIIRPPSGGSFVLTVYTASAENRVTQSESVIAAIAGMAALKIPGR